MKRPFVAVGGLCERDEKLLMVCEGHSSGEPDEVGSESEWMLPFGKLECAEDLREACRREMLEETGCEVEVGRMRAVVQGVYEGDLAILVFLFEVEIVEEGVSERVDEIVAMEWIDKKVVDRMEEEGVIRDGFPLVEVLREVGEKGFVDLKFEIGGRIAAAFERYVRES